MEKPRFKDVVTSIRPGTKVRAIYGSTRREIIGIYQQAKQQGYEYIMVGEELLYFRQLKHLEPHE